MCGVVVIYRQSENYISAINIKNIGISICELSIVGSVRIGAIDKVMIVAIDIKSYRNM